MTPPAMLALGATALACAASTAMAVADRLAMGRKRVEMPGSVGPEMRLQLLALVPPGAAVSVQSVAEAGAVEFAHAVLRLFQAEGRAAEATVGTVLGIGGSGYLHHATGRTHSILVLGPPHGAVEDPPAGLA